MANGVELTATLAKSWAKSSSDVYNDTIKTARDMGNLRLNYSRLNMITTLSENETEDWFSFKSLSKGKLRLSAINVSALQDKSKDVSQDDIDNAASDYEKATADFKAKGLRVEIYTKQGYRDKMIATNDDSKSKEYAAFEKMMKGEFDAGKGTYYIHVTTQDGKPVKKDTLYALQVQMGDTYKHDYVTKETAVNHKGLSEGQIQQKKNEEQMNSSMTNATTNSGILSAQGASDLLAAGYTNMATINRASSAGTAARILNLVT